MPIGPESLTSGRLRAPTVVAGLDSGPIGMRILCSKIFLDVKEYPHDFV